jgi:RimJ/RimL family protein N-acetyltransferase
MREGLGMDTRPTGPGGDGRAAAVDQPARTAAGAVTPTLLVSGTRAALGPLRRDLLETYQRWMTDVEVLRGLGQRGVFTLDAEQAWFEGAAKAENAAHFTVYDTDDLHPVGSCSLFGIEHSNATATFGIFIAERRGSGLGTDATRLTLDWAFTMLGLHNVMLEVFAWNAGAIRAYTKAGFREVGRRRGAVVCFGRRFDDVIMDAIAPEFTGSVLGKLVPEGGTAR